MNQVAKVVYGDTDSLYISYEGIFDTIEGADEWPMEEKSDFLVRLHREFLDARNKKEMEDHYYARHCHHMPHEFELETVALAGIWLNVKKRYAQLLTWQDGKIFSSDELKFKAKGMEIVKSSYPPLCRKILKGAVDELIRTEDKNLLHILNMRIQRNLQTWMEADLLDICPSTKVSKYHENFISMEPWGPNMVKACNFAVRGAAYYNWLRETHGLIGDPIYSGKVMYYVVKENRRKKSSDKDIFFCFQPSNPPKWSEQYAPIDRREMFSRCVLNPFNSILEAMGLQSLCLDGYIKLDLFDF